MTTMRETAENLNGSLQQPPVQEVSEPKESIENKTSPLDELHAAPSRSIITVVFYVLLAAAVFMGWKVRDVGLLTPKSGLGYCLGIVGGVMMFLLILYPLRKKKKISLKLGTNKLWFQIHILMGILGPAMVLFHANFHLGSLNSRVVLASTILVMFSGFVGLYIYTRIHYGLYGRRKTIEELLEELKVDRNSLIRAMRDYAPKQQQRLLDFHTRVSIPPIGFLESARRLLVITIQIRCTQFWLQRRLRRTLKAAARRESWSKREKRRIGMIAKGHIAIYLTSIIKIARFSFFERLFSLWSLFHYPLYILLIITGVIHVVAVHMF